MSSTTRFLGTCLAACLISFGLAGCDSGLTSLQDESTPATTDAGGALSKKGGVPGNGGGGGSSAGYDETLSDALAGSGPVQIKSDNKRTLHSVSTTFVLDLNLQATAEQPVTRVQTDPAGRTESEIRADGECAFNCPEPECSGALGGPDGVQDRLQAALTRTGDARPLDVQVTVGQQHLGQAHSDHFIRIRDYNGPGDRVPGYPGFDIGKCGSPECQPVAEFLGPGSDPTDKTAARTFRFHSGTVEVQERLDVNSGAGLKCNNLDEVIVSIVPLSN